MGTNYYLHKKPPCEACGHEPAPLHIGKSSGGWCFSLHVIPEIGINTLKDWRKEWSAAGAVIRNEYGDILTPQEMEDVITKRASSRQWMDFANSYYKDETDFHARNHSERGPNNLLRHRIGPHCIGHGDGAWDYIVGDFS